MQTRGRTTAAAAALEEDFEPANRIESSHKFSRQTPGVMSTMKKPVVRGRSHATTSVGVHLVSDATRSLAPPTNWLKLSRSALLVALLVLVVACSCFSEAKTHHSKRHVSSQQEPSKALAGTRAGSSHENNNWWNLWWQQYISDVVQPYVRKIVSVSVDGKTVSLSDRQALDDSAAGDYIRNEGPDSKGAARHQDDSVPNENYIQQNDIMRQLAADRANNKAARLDEAQDNNIKLREARTLVARGSENSSRPNGEQNSDRAHARPEDEMSWRQLQNNNDLRWQADRPQNVMGTARLMSTTSRLVNRQTMEKPSSTMEQRGVGDQQVDFGIQMRSGAQFSRLNQQQQQQYRPKCQQQALLLKQQIEQQQVQTDQQLNDYNEDELEGVNLLSAMDDVEANKQTDDEDRMRRPVVDSPSSNMIAPIQKVDQMPDQRQTADEIAADMNQQEEAMNRKESDVAGLMSDVSSTSSTAATTTTTTTQESRTNSSSTTPTSTTTQSPPSSEQTVELSETPISFGQEDQSSGTVDQTLAQDNQQPSTTTTTTKTTPSGRVELENGRPATSSTNKQEIQIMSRLPMKQSTTTSTTAAISITNTTSPAATTKTTDTSGISPNSASPTLEPQSVAASGSESTSRSDISSTTTETTKQRPGSTSDPTAISPVNVGTAKSNGTSSGGANTVETSGSEDEEYDETEGGDDNGEQPANSAGTNSAATNDDDNSGDYDEEEDGDELDATEATQATIGTTAQELITTTAFTPSAELTTVTPSSGSKQQSERLSSSTTTTTTEPPATSSSTSTAVSAAAANITTAKQQQLSLSTSLAMEVERLPKDQKTGASTQPADRMSTLSQSTGSSLGSLGDETAITVPIDAIIDMMMTNQQIDDSGDRSRQSSTTSAPSELTTSNDVAQTSSVVSQKTSNEVTNTTKPTADSTDHQQTTKRLQPPPTTQQPTTTPSTMQTTRASSSTPTPETTTTTAASQAAATTTTTATPQFNSIINQMQPSMAPGSMFPSGEDRTQQQRQGNMIVMMPTSQQPAPQMSSAKEEELGGREPKIEMINMDLMPTQRLMMNQQAQGQLPNQLASSGGVGAQQQPATTRQQAGRFMDVGPGMRLRPTTLQHPTAKQQALFHTIRPASIGPNAGMSTAYFIMMNNAPSKMTTILPPSPQEAGVNGAYQRLQAGKTSNFMRVGMGWVPLQQPGQQVMRASTTATPISSSTLSQMNQESRLDDTATTTPRPTEVRPTTVANMRRTQSPTALATTSKSARVQQQATGANQDSAPLSSTVSHPPPQASQATSTTTQTMGQASSSRKPTTELDKNQQTADQKSQVPPIRQPTPSGAIKSASSEGARSKTSFSSVTQAAFVPMKLLENFAGQKLVKIQGPDSQATASRTFGAVEVPKLAANDNQTAPAATMMAIRQFGGTNRITIVSQRPAAAFGRLPASEQQRALSASNARRFQPASFEYGPSIAVRRPDEPLANGQMPNCTLTGRNFCLLTQEYPLNEVRKAVERSFRSVRIMYEELQTVSDQELHKDDFANATNNQAARGKFACQTQVEMMRPGWAKDEISKEWMLVVNTDVFPQRVRTESCAQPNTPCEFIAPFYDSTCQQRYSLHRMIAIDPHDPSRSPQVAVFKFPAGCVCRVHPIRKSVEGSLTTATSTPITAKPPGNKQR